MVTYSSRPSTLESYLGAAPPIPRFLFGAIILAAFQSSLLALGVAYYGGWKGRSPFKNNLSLSPKEVDVVFA